MMSLWWLLLDGVTVVAGLALLRGARLTRSAVAQREERRSGLAASLFGALLILHGALCLALSTRLHG
jgi:hypothetical protein